MPKMKQLAGLLWPKFEGTQSTMEQEASQQEALWAQEGPQGGALNPSHLGRAGNREHTGSVMGL